MGKGINFLNQTGIKQVIKVIKYVIEKWKKDKGNYRSEKKKWAQILKPIEAMESNLEKWGFKRGLRKM